MPLRAEFDGESPTPEAGRARPPEAVGRSPIDLTIMEILTDWTKFPLFLSLLKSCEIRSKTPISLSIFDSSFVHNSSGLDTVSP